MILHNSDPLLSNIDPGNRGSFGASYAPWHVDQCLLGHPLLYGVWHPYKYSLETIYKVFARIIKFLEQGWDLKAGAVVPMKVKLRHMEKTIVGLFLATAANKARLVSTPPGPCE